MDEFRTIAKLWPSGTELDLGTDSNLLGGPATFNRNAAGFVTSPDGSQNYQFLFWNTGRHMTSKRRVKWIFSVLGWGTWTATRWYGTPSTGPGGPKRVHVEPFTIGGDAILSGGTAIDGPASTYPAGAFPFSGNDREIGTASGPVDVVAKDPFNDYEFSGWMRLIWGGDPVGEFVETDSGSGGAIGGAGFYDHVLGGSFHAAQNTSADLLATYGKHNPGGGGGGFGLPPWFEDLWRERGPFEIPQKGDPSPMDLIRLKLLEELLRKTQPGKTPGTDFSQLITEAPKMNKEQLKRAMQSVKNSLNLGKTALTALEKRLKSPGK